MGNLCAFIVSSLLFIGPGSAGQGRPADLVRQAANRQLAAHKLLEIGPSIHLPEDYPLPKPYKLVNLEEIRGKPMVSTSGRVFLMTDDGKFQELKLDGMELKDLILKASVSGKYHQLLAIIKVPQDGKPGDFVDYGPWLGKEWAGLTNLPQGNWVYAHPYWVIWGGNHQIPPAWQTTLERLLPEDQAVVVTGSSNGTLFNVTSLRTVEKDYIKKTIKVDLQGQLKFDPKEIYRPYGVYWYVTVNGRQYWLHGKVLQTAEMLTGVVRVSGTLETVGGYHIVHVSDMKPVKVAPDFATVTVNGTLKGDYVELPFDIYPPKYGWKWTLAANGRAFQLAIAPELLKKATKLNDERVILTGKLEGDTIRVTTLGADYTESLRTPAPSITAKGLLDYIELEINPPIQVWKLHVNGQTFNVTFGGNEQLRQLARKLGGKKVFVTGTLHGDTVRITSLTDASEEFINQTVEVEIKGKLEQRVIEGARLLPGGYKAGKFSVWFVVVNGQAFELELGWRELTRIARRLEGQQVIVTGTLNNDGRVDVSDLYSNEPQLPDDRAPLQLLIDESKRVATPDQAGINMGKRMDVRGVLRMGTDVGYHILGTPVLRVNDKTYALDFTLKPELEKLANKLDLRTVQITGIDGGVRRFGSMANPQGIDLPVVIVTGVKTSPIKVKYVQAGGIAGRKFEFTIDSDKLTADAERELRHRIEDAKFYDLPKEFEAEHPVFDGFSYTLTVEMDRKTHTVNLQDGSTNVPPALWKLVAELQKQMGAKKIIESSVKPPSDKAISK